MKSRKEKFREERAIGEDVVANYGEDRRECCVFKSRETWVYFMFCSV